MKVQRLGFVIVLLAARVYQDRLLFKKQSIYLLTTHASTCSRSAMCYSSATATHNSQFTIHNAQLTTHDSRQTSLRTSTFASYSKS